MKVTNEDRSDKNQRRHRGKLFALLSDGNWHASEEVSQVAGSGFHVSLYRLRSAGCAIECDRREGVWRYRMVGTENLTSKESQSSLGGGQCEVGR